MTDNLSKISFLILLILTACTPHFQKPVIDDHAQLALPERTMKGIPVMKYHHGMLEDFSYETSRWSSWSEKLVITFEKKSLKIEAKQAGPDYANVSFKFPALDFKEASVLKITARAEGDSMPVLKVILKDLKGRETNAANQYDTIKSSAWKDYYFYFRGKWLQNWPEPGKVDSTSISEMLIYVNSGGPAYSGTIYIEGVSAIKEEDAPKEIVNIKKPEKPEAIQQKDSLEENAEPNMLYSYKQTTDSWWGDKKITLVKKDSALVITAYEVGPKYEVFGKSLKPMNFGNTGVVRIKAKSESRRDPVLHLSITDQAGHGANFDADTAVISNEEAYKNYYFNFNGKYKQVWPDTADVDSTRIVSLTLFINGGKQPFTGKIHIKEVEVIEASGIPEEETERINLLKKAKADRQKVIKEKPLETGMLYSYKDSIQSWWSDKAITLLDKDGDLAIIGYDVGPKYEVFGKSFNPMNFTNSGVVRVRAKAEGSFTPILSMSLSDKAGHGANFKPQTEKITNGKDYKDYFFNFNGKYKQIWPDTADVNSAEIISIVLFINAGKKPFTGTLLINEVEVMTEAHAKKMQARKED